MAGEIITPLGKIKILIDNKEIEYVPIKGNQLDALCPDVLERYQIEIDYVPDGSKHTISCVFLSDCKTKNYWESGENLECQAFYYDFVKLSIGTNGDIDNYVDYDINYLDNGMQYEIFPKTMCRKYVFGICWIDEIDPNDTSDYMQHRDTQTWFGADPTISIVE